MPLERRIARARAEAGLTQSALASRLATLDPELFGATTHTSISGWERGAPRLAFHVVDAIASVTGKPLDYFSERSEAARSPQEATEARGEGETLVQLLAAQSRTLAEIQASIETLGRELQARVPLPGEQRG